jgi:hypothetical protein
MPRSLPALSPRGRLLQSITPPSCGQQSEANSSRTKPLARLLMPLAAPLPALLPIRNERVRLTQRLYRTHVQAPRSPQNATALTYKKALMCHLSAPSPAVFLRW